MVTDSDSYGIHNYKSQTVCFTCFLYLYKQGRRSIQQLNEYFPVVNEDEDSNDAIDSQRASLEEGMF